jgi:RNA polymerase sigma factor (sigma-70 family)
VTGDPSDADGVDDRELLRRHLDGDPDAFGELVARHRDRLWSVALRTIGDREEAADAVQDACVSAYRRAHTYRGDAAVTTWLHRIVVNACLDRVRRRKARPAQPLPEHEDHAAVLGQEPVADPAEQTERRALVLAALAQLSEDHRRAVVLVDMEGYSVEEAAQLLGCPAGTVKSRCARARARLLPLLRDLRDDGRGNRTGAESVLASGDVRPPRDQQPRARR